MFGVMTFDPSSNGRFWPSYETACARVYPWMPGDGQIHVFPIQKNRWLPKTLNFPIQNARDLKSSWFLKLQKWKMFQEQTWAGRTSNLASWFNPFQANMLPRAWAEANCSYDFPIGDANIHTTSKTGKIQTLGEHPKKLPRSDMSACGHTIYGDDSDLVAWKNPHLYPLIHTFLCMLLMPYFS